MVNEDGDVPVMNSLPSNKPAVKPMYAYVITIPPEDVIETVSEPDYSDNVAQRSCRNLRQVNSKIATSTPIARKFIFRPKSSRDQLFNCPKLTRCKLYQWRAIDSIRKTKSSEVPTSNNWQSRAETASTPHLINNSGRSLEGIVEEKLRHEQQQKIHLNRSALCFDNLRWICAFLNSVILIISILYFGTALAFTLSEEILLLVVKYKVYVSLIVSFYIASFFLWVISISGFWVLWKLSRKTKMHACLTSISGILMLSMVFLQNSTQKSIEFDIEPQMRSTLISNNEDSVKDSWDYFHNTFKCCGVNGFLDWCLLKKSQTNEIEAESFLGTYVCSIPNSCCTRYDNEYKNFDINKSESCNEMLKSGKMRNVGCVNSVKKEIYHLGKMYKIITAGAAGVLILLTVMSVALFLCFKR